MTCTIRRQLLNGLIVLFAAIAFTAPSRADLKDTIGDTWAQGIASLDYTTAKCADRLEFNGINYVMMQAMWRGLIVDDTSGSLQKLHLKELQAVKNDMEAAQREGKDICLIMFLWFRTIYSETSPIEKIN